MRFDQVQTFILAKKIFWGEGHSAEKITQKSVFHTNLVILRLITNFWMKDNNKFDGKLVRYECFRIFFSNIFSPGPSANNALD